LQKSPEIHVICEATGGYERALVGALHKASIPVSVTNPARVRAAATAQGERAKTDRIDARMLSDFGQRYNPQLTPPASATQNKLAALTQWLQQLIGGLALAKTQAEHHQDRFVQCQHAKLIKHLESQIQAVEEKLAALTEENAELKRRVECLDAIEGVGQRTAWLVLAHMPELGLLNRQQVAALAGLAPWTRDSGTMKGLRCIGGARTEIRPVLYMAALSAVRCNPVLRSVYQHLRAKGKLPKVALTAVMRRLLTYMNRQIKHLHSKDPLQAPPSLQKPTLA